MTRPTRCLAVERRLLGSTLLAVPAVHFRAAFAEAVNALCRDPGTRPQAIAVELGPAALGAVVTWLRELGVGPRRRTPLPCMFGLTKLRHTGGEQLSLSLGGPIDHSWYDLSETAVATLLQLSATDSIIEAVRCALELEVPVYGVDLDDYGEADRTAVMHQDPRLALEDIAGYVERNARYACLGRDALVDGAREQVMAGRLRSLLRDHEGDRVLFTGGLAHWLPLSSLLEDEDAVRAEAVGCVEPDGITYRRVLVHPIHALHCMDAFPVITEIYERCRRHPLDASPHDDASPAWEDSVGVVPSTAYEKHLTNDEPGYALDDRGEDLQARASFEQFLSNLCVVKQHTPDMSTLVEAAGGTMSSTFVETLVEVLMSISWATPNDHPGLPILDWVQPPHGSGPRGRLIDSNGRRGRPFTVEYGDRNGQRVRIGVPWQWKSDSAEPECDMLPGDRSQGPLPRTWPPHDFLLTAMSVRAGQLAGAELLERSPMAFEGSMGDGIDIKATLRARVAGDRRIYVRHRLTLHGTHEDDPFGPFPTVYIFRPGPAASSRWSVHGCPLEEFRPYVSNPEALDRIMETTPFMVDGLSFHEDAPVPDRLTSVVEDSTMLRGTVHFSYGPNTLQEARWLERTGYTRGPLLESTGSLFGIGFTDLAKGMKDRFGVELDEQDWEVSMVGVALRYAPKHLNVVAPDGFVLPARLYREARACGVSLTVLPLSLFDREQIRKVSLQHIVRPADNCGGYSKHVEQMMGEPANAYLNLLPRALRRLGLDET